MDIGPLMTQLATPPFPPNQPSSEFPPVVTPGGICSTTSIPCTGLDTEEVKLHMRDLAVEFFNTRLAVDRDGDGVPDATDNCPAAANGDQADTDADGTGNACDPTPYGTTPPELTVPADFAADATGPAGGRSRSTRPRPTTWTRPRPRPARPSRAAVRDRRHSGRVRRHRPRR